MNAQQNEQLRAELIYALGGFARWMNRPVAKVQVFTWRTANDITFLAGCPCIRLLRPYRDEANKAFRIRLARAIKQVRKSFKIILPCYDERNAEYTREILANRTA